MAARLAVLYPYLTLCSPEPSARLSLKYIGEGCPGSQDTGPTGGGEGEGRYSVMMHQGARLLGCTRSPGGLGLGRWPGLVLGLAGWRSKVEARGQRDCQPPFAALPCPSLPTLLSPAARSVTHTLQAVQATLTLSEWRTNNDSALGSKEIKVGDDHLQNFAGSDNTMPYHTVSKRMTRGVSVF